MANILKLVVLQVAAAGWLLMGTILVYPVASALASALFRLLGQ